MGNVTHFQVLADPEILAEQRPIRLTDRQIEVLDLLCKGMPNKVISRRLGISGATVKVHVSSVLRSLGVATRLQAVVVAQNLGIIAKPDYDEFDDAQSHGSERLGRLPQVQVEIFQGG